MGTDAIKTTVQEIVHNTNCTHQRIGWASACGTVAAALTALREAREITPTTSIRILGFLEAMMVECEASIWTDEHVRTTLGLGEGA